MEFQEYFKKYTSSVEAKSIIKASNIINEDGFGLWSFKKLIFLDYYLKPYLQIVQNLGCKCIYLDLFSGYGANKIKENNSISIGSPIISLLSGIIPNRTKGYNNRFDKWYFIESNSIYCAALRDRVKCTIELLKEKELLKLDKDIFVFEGDVNEKINKIVEQIKNEYKSQKIAVLAFIDPYKFSDIFVDSWRKLLELKFVDIIFTLPTVTMNRGIEVMKESNRTKYLPPSLLEKCKNGKFCDLSDEEKSGSYAEYIASIVKRSINSYERGIVVSNTLNGELYRILLFSHSKKIFDICEKCADELDKMKIPHIRSLLDQAEGKQKIISDFKR